MMEPLQRPAASERAPTEALPQRKNQRRRRKEPTETGPTTLNADLKTAFAANDGTLAIKLLAAGSPVRKRKEAATPAPPPMPVMPPEPIPNTVPQQTIADLSRVLKLAGDDLVTQADEALRALDVFSFSLGELQRAYEAVLAAHDRADQPSAAADLLSSMATRGASALALSSHLYPSPLTVFLFLSVCAQASRRRSRASARPSRRAAGTATGPHACG